MTGPTPPRLDVRIRRRVHPGLEVDVGFGLGDEAAVLFGPSGSGKTTILRIIAGLCRPDAGSVRAGDRTLVDVERRRWTPLRMRKVGMIFQDDLLFPHLDVRANVRFGLRGWRRAEAEARVDEVAALCGVGGLLGRRVVALSGGERQRVGLARALAPRPRLLLCDEPVSALDLDARFALIDRLVAARRAEAIPMLCVTHSPDEAQALGGRLLRLEAGRIVDDGPPLDVLARSARGASAWPSIRNAFDATVVGHDADGGSSVLAIDDGPSLAVPRLDRPAGARARVSVRSDEIVLARGPVGLVSARNVIEGVVERSIAHGDEAEVIVRAGGAIWVVGVVAGAVGSLGLHAGAEVRMIVKARSCRIEPEDPR